MTKHKECVAFYDKHKEYVVYSNALANNNAMSDWITSEICESIFRDILSETRRHEQRRL